MNLLDLQNNASYRIVITPVRTSNHMNKYKSEIFTSINQIPDSIDRSEELKVNKTVNGSSLEVLGYVQ